MKKLSIITICKNNPAIIDTCESIINQSWQDFEWILIDGGSTDTTLEIIEKYKYRINHFISEPDFGIYDAMNKGIKFATGEYVLFLNGGDLLIEGALEKVFSENPTADVLYGDITFWHNDLAHNICSKKLPEDFDKEFFITHTLYHPASFIKTNLFENFGLYNTNYRIVSDWEKFIMFKLNNVKFKKIDVLITHFNHGGISSDKIFSKLHKNERAEVLKQYFTKKELDDCYKKSLKKYHYIFSLKNEMPNKILRFFGIKIKLKKYGII